MNLLRSGDYEETKAAVHTCALGLCAVMALYNGAAWLSRRQLHLAFNAGLYTIGVLWELKQVNRHLRDH